MLPFSLLQSKGENHESLLAYLLLRLIGWDYAVECGKLLKEMKNVCFASSPRKRTTETVPDKNNRKLNQLFV